MHIERLRLVNFRQHEDTELVLGPGLTGIVGPNGAGKTTLLEAIAWGLYGAEAARGTKETIRRRSASPRAPVRVELEFSLGSHRYRVVRGLSTAELYQDGDPTPVAHSLVEVTARVGRMLGMAREEFFNTYFTGQKQLAVMAAMRPVERAQFLSRVLGYDRLQLAQERVREHRLSVRARVGALQSSLTDPAELAAEEERAQNRLDGAQEAVARAQENHERAEQRRAEVTPRWEASQRLQEQIRVLEGEFRLAEHKVQAARETFQRLDRQLVAANEARGRLDAMRASLEPLAALRAERSKLDGEAERHAVARAATAQLLEVRSSLRQVEERINRLPPPEEVAHGVERADQVRRQLTQISEEAEEKRTAWVRDLQDARTKREGLLDQYKDLKEQQQRITAAGAEGICPTCARPLGKEYENVVGMLDRQLQDVLFNGNYYKQRIEQLAHEPPELQDLDRQIEALEKESATAAAEGGRQQALAQEGPVLAREQGRLIARIRELESVVAQEPKGYDPARHAEVRRLIGELEPLELQAERHRAMAERAEVLVGEAEAAERELSIVETHALELRHRMDSLGYTEASFLEARSAHEAVEQERREAEMMGIRALVEVEAAKDALAAVQRRRAERAAREEELRQAAKSLALHNELDRAFTDLRTELNLQLRPDLSELASGFLRDLTNGRYTEMELDEDYMATLLDGGEAKPVISGGEEDIANLALRLAISQMIADRAGQPLSILFLDEILGSLDEERRLAVIELLRSLADRFPQVILITHIEPMRDAGFDRIIRVEYDADRGVAQVHDEPEGVLDGLAA
ncbi:MAG TPA: SMC family ATPase [Gemmatimonadales bacterium]